MTQRSWSNFLGLTALDVVSGNVSHCISDNQAQHTAGMFARQARWEVLAAALGETRKNMMRPIERQRHQFLMRERMAEGLSP